MEQNSKKVFSRIGLALALTVISVNIGQAILVTLFNMFIPNLASSGWTSYLLIGVFYLIGFPLFFLITKSLPNGEKRESKKLSVKEIVILFCICYMLTLIINLITTALMYLISLAKGGEVINPLQNLVSSSNSIGAFLFIGILSPIIEETLFRGLMLNKLRPFGDKIAIITTAVLFGLFHGNFSQFFYATALGLVFAYITLKTGTIKYSIILHMCVNMMGSVATVFATKSNVAGAIFTVAVIIILILGIISFIKSIKKVSLCKGDMEIERGQVFKTTCLNFGMIFNFLINFALMILVLFM